MIWGILERKSRIVMRGAELERIIRSRLYSIDKRRRIFIIYLKILICTSN